MIRRMNNKGQVLILFVALIPILIAVLAIAFDLGLITYNKKQLDGINIEALDYVKENIDDYKEDNIKKIIKENDKDITISSIKENNDSVEVILTKKTNSAFGAIIGINSYDITSKYILDKETKKIIKE